MMNFDAPALPAGTSTVVPPKVKLVTLSASVSRLATSSFVRTFPERAVSSDVETTSSTETNSSLTPVILNVTVFVSLVPAASFTMNV